MTKTQLKKWIETQRNKALNEARKIYLQKLAEHEENIYKEMGLHELAEEIQELLNKVDDKIKKWKSEYKRKGIEFSDAYYTLENKLYDYIKGENATFERLSKSEFKDSTDKRYQITRKYELNTQEINRNYDNVIANIQNLKNAKTGMEYLQKLGFDLTELIKQDEKPVTALVAKIDTNYLFISKGDAVNE